MKIFILILLAVPSAFAQNMGLNSSISMQTSKSAAPHMLKMNMQKFTAKLKAGRTYIDQGNYEEAIAILLKAKRQKESAKLYEYLGDAYTANRQYSKAVQAYQKAFKKYIKRKNKHAAKRVLDTLKFYQTDKTKELNKKFENSLESL